MSGAPPAAMRRSAIVRLDATCVGGMWTAVENSQPVRPPNVLTLSCKSRPPCRPPSGGAAAAATNMQWREPSAADVTPACSSEPPEGGSAAEPGLGGFCQLVRAVSPPFAMAFESPYRTVAAHGEYACEVP